MNDANSFFTLLPELTRVSEGKDDTEMEDLDQSQLSQYPLRVLGDSSNADIAMAGSNSGHDYAEYSRSEDRNYTGISEGPLNVTSPVDISIYVPDNDDNLPPNNDATAGGFDYHSPSSSSSAYFIIGRGVETQENVSLSKMSFVRAPLSQSESLTLTPQSDLKEEISGLPDMYLQPTTKCEFEGCADRSGATDEDIVDWPSDNEEEIYIESKPNFKDKPRGEPMGSEDVFAPNAKTNFNHGGDVRPPLVGQSEENNDNLIQFTLDERLTEHRSESQDLMEVDGFTPILDTNDHMSETTDNLSDLDLHRNDMVNHRALSPSVSVSSVASSKRLEWDSGADIGYGGPKVTYGLSTLERMAIGCSALKKRMEPEGKSCLVSNGPLIPLQVVPRTIVNDEESVGDKNKKETKDIFENVLVVRNKSIRSASLSDLSNSKSRSKASKKHSSSSTDIFSNSPVFGPNNMISTSSCSVSTCSSNTVIGIPYISEDRQVTSLRNNFAAGGDSEILNRSYQQPVESGIKLQDNVTEGQTDIMTQTQRFVNQCCTNLDESVKGWLVNKIIEDFNYGVESMQIPVSSAALPTVPIPPPPDFDDPILPQISNSIDWRQSASSETRVNSCNFDLESPIDMKNNCLDVSSRDSDSSVNTVKEIQQQLASSFEYYDPSKAEKTERKILTSESNTSTDDSTWINVLKKSSKIQRPAFVKFDHLRNSRQHSKVINSSDEEPFSSSRDIFLKFSTTRKPHSIISSESSVSDNYYEETNSLQTMKGFIRRLEVLDTWHPEGVELVKELIQKQRKSYIRRLQREVDWLERIERILNVKSTADRNLEAELGLSKRNGYKHKSKKPQSATKTMKDFAQCYPTPIPSDSDSYQSKSFSKIRKCSVGIQTARSESVSPITFLNSDLLSPQLIPEKERPVVSVPLHKINGSPYKQSKSTSSLIKGKDKVSLDKSKPVAWFLPVGNGQPKLLTRVRRGVADGQQSGSPDTRTSGRKFTWASKNVYPLPLQESFKMFKPNTIKRVESRQRNLKLEVELRKRVGSYRNGLLTNYPQRIFHRVTIPLPISVQHHRPQKRTFSHYEMREQTEKIYSELPEITARKELKVRENVYRTNRLMANMFRKKLQGKVLKGQVSHLTNQKCV
ncbi:hypothetical protein CHUAL_005313 [Chamberlinius hualienensis]